MCKKIACSYSANADLYELVEHFIFMACPSLRSGRAIRCKSSFATLIAGFPLLSLTRVRVHIRYVSALGMRRACVSMVRIAPKR
jgi:hypothetical protein